MTRRANRLRDATVLTARVAPSVVRYLLRTLGAPIVLLVVAAAAAVLLGEPSLALLALELAAIFGVGVLTAFALHELAHVFVLGLARGVRTVTVEQTALRLSVRAEGGLTRLQAVCGALAGPLVPVSGGLLLLAADRWTVVGWLGVLHLAFLLPVFGDGRVLVRALFPLSTPGTEHV